MSRTLLLTSLLLSAGCVGLTSAERARTLGAGQMQLTFGGEYAGSPHGQIGRAELGGRVGVADWLDLHGRLGAAVEFPCGICTNIEFQSAEFEAGAKLAVTPQDQRFVVSVDPTLGFIPGTFSYAKLPVHAGYLLPNGDEIVLTPMAGYMLGANIGSVSGSLAYVWKVGGMLVIPEVEVGAAQSFDPSGPSYGISDLVGPHLQAGITLAWGDSKHVPGGAH